MTSHQQPSAQARHFIAPMLIFLGLLGLVPLIEIDNPDLPWWRWMPEQWTYPLQTLVCGLLVALWWRHYPWGLMTFRTISIGALAGGLGIAVWIWGPRFSEAEPGSGFDPHALGETAFPWVVALRFLRMAVVVPFVEEIFWRGFVQRALVRGGGYEWASVPLGKAGLWSVIGTTLLFASVHSPLDWPVAIFYGALACGVGIWTRSLAACVVMHAVANLLLGIYIMTTESWNLW